MTEHIHKRLTDEQARMILGRYIKREFKREQAMNLLGLKCSQFFELIKKYRKAPDGFTIEYGRKWSNRKIDEGIEGNIVKELRVEKALIDDRATPIRFWHKGRLVGTQKFKHLTQKHTFKSALLIFNLKPASFFRL